MDEKLDFIKLRLDGPYEKDTLTCGYLLLFVSTLSILECLTILKFEEFSFFGFKFKDVNPNLLIVVFLIAIAILILIFNSMVASNYFNWRRKIRQADNTIKLEHRARRRKMYQNWARSSINKNSSLTLPKEDIEDILTWEKDQWAFAKQARWTAYFKIAIHYVLPMLVSIVALVLLINKI